MTDFSECLCEAQPLEREWGSADNGTDETEPEPTNPPGRGELILFVDNDDTWLWIGQKILSRLGYRMVGYSSPNSALNMFRMQPRSFDLVITDLCMPELDGFELAARLRQYRPDVPIIMITAGETGAVREVHKKGIGRLVPKQDLARSLGKTVEDVLTEYRARGGMSSSC
jgi:CheY-like chemotaxis protein